ncbi:MAG: DUF4382 domain-containing protein [Phormidesmis sp.]
MATKLRSPSPAHSPAHSPTHSSTLSTRQRLVAGPMRVVSVILLSLSLLSCSSQSSTTPSDASEPSANAGDTSDETDTAGSGTLVVNANGEDFVRQGFVDKDGWQINFDHVYVTLADITATQSDPPFEAGKDQPLKATEQVKVADPVTVDLAAGEADADPITVAEIPDAPSGRYNALAWQLVPAKTGPAAGYPLMMAGSATKAGETIPFQIQLADQLAFSCGDFVGEERKGFLDSSDTADVEATFHFDHLFGDGEAAADDEINTGALGFDKLAELAEGGSLTVNSDQLKEQLSTEDYNSLETILTSLGHVGEGHCETTQVS